LTTSGITAVGSQLPAASTTPIGAEWTAPAASSNRTSTRSVDIEILNKPASLTDEEMAIVQKHTLEGEDMLSRIGGVLGDVGSVVRSHHERFDGKGYPDGLEGEQIPLASRVIACCDAFNAMTTDRVYRAAMPAEAAVAELRSEAGAQFDPEVVEALVGIVESWDAAQMGEISDPASQNGSALSTARTGA
jgi:HD-GYP domain-containing protein (c-di-GMP phosphodiesterase class II)